jgi:hypothetical protein
VPNLSYGDRRQLTLLPASRYPALLKQSPISLGRGNGALSLFHPGYSFPRLLNLDCFWINKRDVRRGGKSKINILEWGGKGKENPEEDRIQETAAVAVGYGGQGRQEEKGGNNGKME